MYRVNTVLLTRGRAIYCCWPRCRRLLFVEGRALLGAAAVQAPRPAPSAPAASCPCRGRTCCGPGTPRAWVTLLASAAAAASGAAHAPPLKTLRPRTCRGQTASALRSLPCSAGLQWGARPRGLAGVPALHPRTAPLPRTAAAQTRRCATPRPPAAAVPGHSRRRTCHSTSHARNWEGSDLLYGPCRCSRRLLRLCPPPAFPLRKEVRDFLVHG